MLNAVLMASVSENCECITNGVNWLNEEMNKNLRGGKTTSIVNEIKRSFKNSTSVSVNVPVMSVAKQGTGMIATSGTG